MAIELITTDGIFALDGGAWEVTNNIWIVGNDAEVVVFDAAHDHEAIVEAVNGRRVAAIVLTHGHEDHIGAVPYLLRLRPDIPIYGSRLTLALLAAKLREEAARRGMAGLLARILDARARSLGLPLQILIDALPGERSLIDPIIRDSGGLVTLLAAPPDFERYKGVLQELDILVTPNTGPMHIAAAVGTPVVGLFSGWSAADCGPFVPPERFVALQAADRGGGGSGLAAITPEQVAEAVFRLLAPSRPA